jgi:hypothetical protein
MKSTGEGRQWMPTAASAANVSGVETHKQPSRANEGRMLPTANGGEPMKATNAVVQSALAHYLDLDPLSLQSWHHLELDLHLSPGDVALVARAMEDKADVELPRERLDAAATVGDLQMLLSRAIAQKPAHSLNRVA